MVSFRHMMQDAILAMAKQFAYEPVIENRGMLPRFERVIVAGMGGSHLAADLLSMLDPSLSLRVHSDYGLPVLSPEEKAHTLVIASSYSGNTEETLDAYAQARAEGVAVAAIAVGGKLIELARRDGVPFVQLPNTGIQPRSALGFSLMALLALLGKDSLLSEARRLVTELQPDALQEEGKRLAEWLQGKVPIVYASRSRGPIAYNWKIKLNETGKVPAFFNLVPELNHNEMTGFDVVEATRDLSSRFAFIFLQDELDHPRNQRRMEVMARLYRDRGLSVKEIRLEGEKLFHKTFASLLLADWTAVALAAHYGLESEQVPMVEEFKKML